MRAEAPLLLLLCSAALTAAELLLVNVVFRHGPRTPEDTYPNDPYINYNFAPFGWGQLTNNGKFSQYQQGIWLRKRYASFLGDAYSPKILVARSTDCDRTKMSAQLQLAGLFPPNSEQRWHPKLNWQPIPVHSQPMRADDLLLVRIPCPRYYKELSKVMELEEVQEKLESLHARELYTNLSKITGFAVENPDDIQSLYFTLKTEADFPLELPEWTNDYFPHKLAPIAAYSFTLNGYNKVLRRIKGGPLLRKITRDMRAKAEEVLLPPERKFYMYAGHDSTIANLLLALNAWDEQIPAYGATIMIELHKNYLNEGHTVQIFFRNSTEHEPYALKIPGCNHDCPLDDFLALTADVMPNDLQEECKVDDPNYVPPTPGPP